MTRDKFIVNLVFLVLQKTQNHRLSPRTALQRFHNARNELSTVIVWVNPLALNQTKNQAGCKVLPTWLVPRR